MKKRQRIISLFLILLVLFLLTPGCKNEVEAPPENSIPLLTFSVNQKAGYVEAYLNYWDIEKGKIVQANKVLYTVTAQPPRTTNPKFLDWGWLIHFYGPPLSWDGESYIYLSKKTHKPVEIPSYLKLMSFDYSRSTPCGEFFSNFSKNLQIKMKNTCKDYLNEKYTRFIYRVFNNGNVKEKLVNVSLYNDIFHGGVNIGQACLYEKEKNEVKQLLLYYDKSGEGYILICTINLEKGTYEWHKVNGIRGCIPNMDQRDISIIDGKFYIPLCGTYIGIINPDNYTGKVFDLRRIAKMLSFYNAPVYWGPEPIMYGEYKEFLILNGQVAYGNQKESGELGNDFKHIWVIYDTKANKVVQILEWHSTEPHFFLIRGPDGKELSRIESDKLIKDISKLPIIYGGSYLDGIWFIADNFIIFPHKNGS